MKRLTKWIFLGALVVCLGLAVTHNVSTIPTIEDRAAVEKMLKSAGYGDLLRQAPTSFEEEIDAILQVQDAVLSAAPVNEGIPLGRSREPADLVASGKGLCYDRSRSIEKALAVIGIKTRHVSIYAKANGSALSALLTPRISSHAVSEARTRNGWVVIDSNARWISLSAANQTLSVRDLAKLPEEKWSSRLVSRPSAEFLRPFVPVYGLYSRHGRFYPPMNFIPDMNWAEAMANLYSS